MKIPFRVSLLAFAVCTAAQTSAQEANLAETIVIQESAAHYVSKGAVLAGKSNRSNATSAYSISEISADFIEDSGALTLQDALTYSAGVFAGQFGNDSRLDAVQIRGAQTSSYLDGLRTDFGYYNRTRIEPYSLERIEVLKGPASSLYGEGGTGGLVASQSKAPTGESVSEIELQGGNFKRKQLAIDTQGVVDGNDKLSYRVVALARDADTMVDEVEDNRVMFNPSLRWQISDATDLTLIGNFQRDEGGTSLQFLPQNLTINAESNKKLPSSTFLANPNFDQYDTATNALTVKFNHQLNEKWKLSSNFRYLKGESTYNTQYPIEKGGLARGMVALGLAPNLAVASGGLNALVPGDNLLMLSESQTRELESIGWDSRINTQIMSGKAKHDLTLGIDIGHNTLDSSAWSDTAEINGLLAAAAGGNTAAAVGLMAKQIDPFNPNAAVPTGITYVDRPTNTLKQQGVYLQDDISVGKWEINGALRWSHYSNETSTGDKDISGSELSGRIGALYRLDNGVSPYISYSSAFNPIAGLDASNNPYKPVESANTEIGIKYQPEGSHWSLNSAIYKTVENNRQIQDPNNQLLGTNIQLDEVDIQGFETELRGKWGRWDVLANYSLTDSEVTKSSAAAYQGEQLMGVPEQQASIFAKYSVDAALSVGAGVRYVGSSENGFGTLDVPSVALYDAMISYGLNDWQLAVNARNLADKEYIASCSGDLYCYYGERRSVLLSAKYQF